MTFFTLQLGLGADVPIQQGGTGPDEPTWYFDLDEQFELAKRGAEELGLQFRVGEVDTVPEEDFVSDAAEFLTYAKLQVQERRAELARADRLLTASELAEKYSDTDEHPQHLKTHWQESVIQNSTLLGYWEWVEFQCEEEE